MSSMWVQNIPKETEASLAANLFSDLGNPSSLCLHVELKTEKG